MGRCGGWICVQSWWLQVIAEGSAPLTFLWYMRWPGLIGASKVLAICDLWQTDGHDLRLLSCGHGK